MRRALHIQGERLHPAFKLRNFRRKASDAADELRENQGKNTPKPGCGWISDPPPRGLHHFCMADNEIGAHNLVFRPDVLKQGTTDAMLRRALRTGAIERVWQGAYLPVTAGVDSHTVRLERYRAKVIAAARHGGPGRTASHTSGAAMHRIPMLHPDYSTVHFTSATTGKRSARGLIHQAKLSSSDVVMLDDIPVTSRVRSICDVARIGTVQQAVCALDSGLHLGVPMAELEEQVRRLGRHHGASTLRAALSMANALAESVGETVSRLVMADDPQIPVPELQAPIEIDLDGTTTVFGDFGWRDANGVLRLVGEFDGRIKYHRSNPWDDSMPEETIYEEKLREDAIRATGPSLVRWTWTESMRPKVLQLKIIGALTAAGLIS